MKQTNTTLNASLEIEKNLLFIRKEKSPKKMHIMEVKISTPRFRIVHHIKNAVNVSIPIIFLLLTSYHCFFNIYPPMADSPNLFY